MAKLSCSLFFVLMLVFSACLMVERAEGKRCFITIDQRTPCDNGVDCRLSCYTGYNGVGKCFDDHKVPGPMVTGEAPAFDGSVRLYNAVKKLGFTIILLTGRDEYQRGITESNLKNVGYSGWDRLILRGSEDQGKAATEYISEQRAKLVEEGFKIRGNVGDQWSDLLGSFVADRSFKVPNPMYYIP